MDIVFVILHYKTYKDTVECVGSIQKKVDTDKYHIVIIDNASSNGSLEELQTYYRDEKKITIISNHQNMGFARGLNIGIRYARKKYEPQYIAAINNDILLLNDDIVFKLNEKMQKYQFTVCGPMIITRDGKCSTNPMGDTITSKEEVDRRINHYKNIIKVCKFGAYSIYKSLKKRHHCNPSMDYLEDKVDYKLHGSFLVFSELFFQDFNGLDESTFLYAEEDILYLHLIKNGHRTLYTPDIRVYHKEDSATNEAIPDDVKKMRFVSDNCIRSLQVYLRLLDEYNDR